MFFSLLALFYFIIGAIELFEVPVSKKIIAAVCLIPAFVLTAFRDVSVGCDTFTYSLVFEKLRYVDSIIDALAWDRMEYGYVSISYLFSHMDLSFSQFQIAGSTFIYASFFLFLIRYSKNIGISCLVFLTMRYMFGPMNAARMYWAMAVLWFAIPFVQKRCYLGFALLVLLASFFQKAAFLFIFLYPLSLIKFTPKKIFLSFFIAGIIGYMGKPFFVFVTHTLGLYESYLNGQYLNFSGNVAVYLVFMIDACLALFVLYNKKTEKNFFNQNLTASISIEKICLCAILVILCCDIVGFNFTLMSRISDFYSFCWLILIPMTFMKMKNKMVAIISLIMFALCLFSQFETIMSLRSNWYCVDPYSFNFGEIF